ncbi:MAG: Chemotaxis response regulator protein-glutamate methylesterase [Phycisphaerae bacterium]|nr:Chemotaxis response regulator protein-glutamate methylesterase [Phycisphaerae bacterium]
MTEAHRVLVVDDNEMNRDMLSRRLARRGIAVETAENGRQALELVAARPYDLVLLDIMMPDVDGLEVLRQIRQTRPPGELPVIMVTAKDQSADVVRALGAGANDYVTKPIDFNVALARLNTHLTVARLNRELAARVSEIEEELQVVADVQRRLLPARLPHAPDLRFAVHYATSRYAGGDYYDVVPLPDGSVGILIADVSGHGTPSAVVMAMTRSVFHALPGPPDQPAEVLCHLNRQLVDLWEDRFVTALYAVIDPARRKMRVASAGHLDPILVRTPPGGVVPLHVPGVIPIGVDALVNVPVAEFELHPTDHLLFFTDGISERFNPRREMYGVERLGRALADAAGADPRNVVARLVADVDAFAADAPPDDDQTFLLCVIGPS